MVGGGKETDPMDRRKSVEECDSRAEGGGNGSTDKAVAVVTGSSTNSRQKVRKK